VLLIDATYECVHGCITENQGILFETCYITPRPRSLRLTAGGAKMTTLTGGESQKVLVVALPLAQFFSLPCLFPYFILHTHYGLTFRHNPRPYVRRNAP
jgi:hypothetical protein